MRVRAIYNEIMRTMSNLSLVICIGIGIRIIIVYVVRERATMIRRTPSKHKQNKTNKSIRNGGCIVPSLSHHYDQAWHEFLDV
jgi:hypothetical protein